MQNLLHSPIFRAINRRYFTPTSSFTSISEDASDSFKIYNEVLALINSVNPIEPALENVSRFLNREIVISVLQSQAQSENDPRICFRFFIWVSKITSLRSGASNRLIVDTLLRGKNGNSFNLYWSVLDELRYQKLSVSADAFSVLILGYWRLRMAEKALEIFGRMNGFSCLIDALMKAKRVSEAEELFQKVLDEGLVPDLVLYTIMLHGLGEAGRMQDAMDIFWDMIGQGIVPDTQCYNVLIKGFCDAGLLEEVLSLKQEISRQDLFPNTCTYTILICGFCRKGLLSKAQLIFDEMDKAGCNPSAVTFNALIDGLCKAGELEQAQLMLYRMEIGKHPSLFLRLSQGADSANIQKTVESLVESGSLVEAYKLLMQLADSGAVPDVRTYNILINGMCRAGRVNVALKLFEQLHIKGLFPDSVTFGTLIDGLERAGKDGIALKIFQQMNENGCTPCPSVYKTLMVWCCRKRRTSEAFGFWLKYLRSRDGFEDGALELIKEFFEKGDFESALRSIVDTDIKLVDFDSAFYSIWLSGLCQVHRVEEALKTLHILEEFNVSVSAPACVILIRALCFQEELNKAVDVFLYTMQKGHRFKRAMCNSVVQALLKSKNEVILALELLDRMKSVGYDLDSHLYPSTKSLLPHIYSVTKNSSAR